MFSVTVKKYVGSQWQLTPDPNTPHNIEMLDIALQESRAFDIVVPHGECVIGTKAESGNLSKKDVRRIHKAVESASPGVKPHVSFVLGK